MATGRRKSKTSKRKRLPWWKKNPEIERITRHIGKVIDNSKIDDWLNLALYGIVGIAGYQAASKLGVDGLGGATAGIIALRLATSDNEIAGASGTAVLAAIGLIDAVNPLAEAVAQAPGVREVVQGQKGIAEVLKKVKKDYEETGKLPPFCSRDIFGQVKCYIPGFGWIYTNWETKAKPELKETELGNVEKEEFRLRDWLP